MKQLLVIILMLAGLTAHAEYRSLRMNNGQYGCFPFSDDGIILSKEPTHYLNCVKSYEILKLNIGGHGCFPLDENKNMLSRLPIGFSDCKTSYEAVHGQIGCFVTDGNKNILYQVRVTSRGEEIPYKLKVGFEACMGDGGVDE